MGGGGVEVCEFRSKIYSGIGSEHHVGCSARRMQWFVVLLLIYATMRNSLSSHAQLPSYHAQHPSYHAQLPPMHNASVSYTCATLLQSITLVYATMRNILPPMHNASVSYTCATLLQSITLVYAALALHSCRATR